MRAGVRYDAGDGHQQDHRPEYLREDVLPPAPEAQGEGERRDLDTPPAMTPVSSMARLPSRVRA